MPQIEYDDGCKDDPNPGALILFWVALVLILAGPSMPVPGCGGMHRCRWPRPEID